MTIKPVHLDLASPKKIPCTQTWNYESSEGPSDSERQFLGLKMFFSVNENQIEYASSFNRKHVIHDFCKFILFLMCVPRKDCEIHH